VVSTLQVKGRTRKEVIKVSSAMGSNPPSTPSSLYIITGTLIPNRTRKIIRLPPPAFNPNTKGEQLYYVQITFILFINSDKRNHGSRSININDVL
jgi:hypothetical protein